MRKKYRSHIGVLLDILEVLASDPEPTVSRIILLANVPHTRLKELLSRLEEKGYIESDKRGNKIVFRLTERGFSLLEYLRRVEKLLSGLGFPL